MKKVSQKKLDFFIDIVDYFFDNDDLHFRSVIIDKSKLNHAAMNQTHDEWYYKMYFELLSKIFDPDKTYCIYLDAKDTRGSLKIKKLHEVLCNDMYDFEQKIIQRVQEGRSYEVAILQITDLLIGALQFNSRDLHAEAKDKIIQRIKERSGSIFQNQRWSKNQSSTSFAGEGGTAFKIKACRYPHGLVRLLICLIMEEM